MTYLLDTMIVSFFLQADRERELAAVAKHCPVAIVDEVRRELKNDRDRGGDLFEKWIATSNIEVRSIVVGSPASTTLADLLNPASLNKGRGERASIALAASDTSLTFVTHDKAAVWIAMRELWTRGERALGLFAFLRRLFDEGALADPVVIDDVMGAVGAATQRPTWWAPWRAGIASSASGAAPPPV